MIQYMIPLVESWLPVWSEYIVVFFAMSFLAFVGCFLHSILRR